MCQASTLSSVTFGGPIPTPAGTRFINPVLSEEGAPVYGRGPTFDYDAETGSLDLFIPPMLGPEDSAGNRAAYIVDTVTIYHGGNIQSRPDFPEATVFVDPKLASVPNSFGSEYTPGKFDQFMDENVGYDLRTRPGYTAVSGLVTPVESGELATVLSLLDTSLPLLGNTFSQGVQAYFPNLLLPGMDVEFEKTPGQIPLVSAEFTVGSVTVPESSQNINVLLPAEVSIEIDYVKIHTNRVFAGRQEVKLEAQALRIPEPSSAVLGVLAFGLLVSRRFLRKTC